VVISLQVENVRKERGMTRYAVYRRTHRNNVRWYVRPLMEGEPKDNCIVFEGEDVMLLACEKARELNEKEGRASSSRLTLETSVLQDSSSLR
jgi:hypothetical protein